MRIAGSFALGWTVIFFVAGALNAEQRVSSLGATAAEASVSEARGDLSDRLEHTVASTTQTRTTEHQLIEALAKLRRGLGLPSVERVPELDRAALLHAKYLLLRAEASHFQADLASPWFSGYDSGTRALHSGFYGDQVKEVLARLSQKADPLESLMAAPYHRAALLSLKANRVGVAILDHRDGARQTVVLLGRAHDLLVPEVGIDAPMHVFPTLETGAVPPSFNSDVEWPDPIARGGIVGYPFSVQVESPEFLFEGISLRAYASDRDEENLIILSKDGGDQKLPRGLYFAMTPQPLLPNTLYEAKVLGHIHGKRVERTWQFRSRESRKTTLTVSQEKIRPGGIVRAVLEMPDVVGGSPATLCAPRGRGIASMNTGAPHTFDLRTDSCSDCRVTLWASESPSCQGRVLAEASLTIGH